MSSGAAGRHPPCWKKSTLPASWGDVVTGNTWWHRHPLGTTLLHGRGSRAGDLRHCRRKPILTLRCRGHRPLGCICQWLAHLRPLECLFGVGDVVDTVLSPHCGLILARPSQSALQVCGVRKKCGEEDNLSEGQVAMGGLGARSAFEPFARERRIQNGTKSKPWGPPLGITWTQAWEAAVWPKGERSLSLP